MDTNIKSINLLPNEYIVAQKMSFYKKIIGVIVVAEVASYIGFVALPPKRELAETQDELLNLQNELASPKYAGVNKTLSDLENAKADIKSWMGEYSKIKQDGAIGSQLLDELISRVPRGVSISGLNIGDQYDKGKAILTTTIKLEGQAETVDDVMDYLSVMETLFLPKDIVNDYAYDKELDCYKFNFTITVKEQFETQKVSEKATQEAASPSDESASGEEGL